MNKIKCVYILKQEILDYLPIKRLLQIFLPCKRYHKTFQLYPSIYELYSNIIKDFFPYNEYIDEDMLSYIIHFSRKQRFLTDTALFEYFFRYLREQKRIYVKYENCYFENLLTFLIKRKYSGTLILKLSEPKLELEKHCNIDIDGNSMINLEIIFDMKWLSKEKTDNMVYIKDFLNKKIVGMETKAAVKKIKFAEHLNLNEDKYEEFLFNFLMPNFQNALFNFQCNYFDSMSYWEELDRFYQLKFIIDQKYEVVESDFNFDIMNNFNCNNKIKTISDINDSNKEKKVIGDVNNNKVDINKIEINNKINNNDNNIIEKKLINDSVVKTFSGSNTKESNQNSVNNLKNNLENNIQNNFIEINNNSINIVNHDEIDSNKTNIKSSIIINENKVISDENKNNINENNDNIIENKDIINEKNINENDANKNENKTIINENNNNINENSVSLNENKNIINENDNHISEKKNIINENANNIKRENENINENKNIINENINNNNNNNENKNIINESENNDRVTESNINVNENDKNLNENNDNSKENNKIVNENNKIDSENNKTTNKEDNQHNTNFLNEKIEIINTINIINEINSSSNGTKEINNKITNVLTTNNNINKTDNNSSQNGIEPVPEIFKINQSILAIKDLHNLILDYRKNKIELTTQYFSYFAKENPPITLPKNITLINFTYEKNKKYFAEFNNKIKTLNIIQRIYRNTPYPMYLSPKLQSLIILRLERINILEENLIEIINNNPALEVFEIHKNYTGYIFGYPLALALSNLKNLKVLVTEFFWYKHNLDNFKTNTILQKTEHEFFKFLTSKTINYLSLSNETNINIMTLHQNLPNLFSLSIEYSSILIQENEPEKKQKKEFHYYNEDRIFLRLRDLTLTKVDNSNEFFRRMAFFNKLETLYLDSFDKEFFQTFVNYGYYMTNLDCLCVSPDFSERIKALESENLVKKLHYLKRLTSLEIGFYTTSEVLSNLLYEELKSMPKLQKLKIVVDVSSEENRSLLETSINRLKNEKYNSKYLNIEISFLDKKLIKK